MADETAFDRQRFIKAMRNVASSVTVVTTDGQAGQAGATVSAFTSVSADPPTVLICLNAESRIAQKVIRNGAYCVNILPEDGQDIADRFAGRHDKAVCNRFTGIERFAFAERGLGIVGATTIACDVQQVVQSGSHLIVIGEVRDICDKVRRPLAYQDGAYQRVVSHVEIMRICN